MSENAKKEVKIIRKVGAGLLILFLIITAIYIVKIINQDTCGRETYTDYGYGALQAAVTMDAANEIVLQHNPYDREKNIKEWRFCFTSNNTDAVELHVVNSADDVLGHFLIPSGYDTHCHNIRFPANETFNYIGLQCLTCSVANPKVTLYEEVLGVDVERVVENTNTFTSTNDNTLDFVLHGAPSCWENIKYFTFWYLTSLILLTLVWFAYMGKDKLKELLEN